MKIKLIRELPEDVFRIETYPNGSPYEAIKSEVEDLIQDLKQQGFKKDK